jgi:hypothetical protein
MPDSMTATILKRRILMRTTSRPCCNKRNNAKAPNFSEVRKGKRGILEFHSVLRPFSDLFAFALIACRKKRDADGEQYGARSGRRRTMLSLFTVFISLLLAFASCAREESAWSPPATGVSLIGELWSCQGIEDVKTSLATSQHAGTNEAKVENATRSRDASEFAALRVTNYYDLEIRGILILEFYQNRLARAIFYADDIAKYLTRLRDRKGVDLMSLKEIFSSPNCRIWRTRDVNGVEYIGREDLRLVTERRNWLKKHA